MSAAAWVDRKVGELEAIALAVVGRVASWVAPIPVAVMTARAIALIFDLPDLWGGITAAALELVGMTTTALWLDLKEYNRTKRKSDPEAGAGLALGMMVAYFVVDLSIIGVITVKEIQDTGNWSRLIAVLFPVMSAVGVIVLNQRVRHYHRLAQIDVGKAERRSKRSHPSQPTAQPADVIVEVPVPAAYQCELCDATFDDPHKIGPHMRWKHPNGNGVKPHRERAEAEV